MSDLQTPQLPLNFVSNYLNLLAGYQCCIAGLGDEMLDEYFVGNIECGNKISNRINLALIYLKTLKNQEFKTTSCIDKTTYCLSLDEIMGIIQALNKICHGCCTDLNFLKSCILT